MTGLPPCGNWINLTAHTGTRNGCLVLDSISIAGYQPGASLLSKTLRLFSDSIDKHLSDECSVDVTNNIMDLGYAPGEMIHLITSGKFDLGYLSTSYFSKAIPQLYITLILECKRITIFMLNHMSISTKKILKQYIFIQKRKLSNYRLKR